MFGSVKSKLIAGFFCMMCVAIAPMALDLLLGHAQAGDGQLWSRIGVLLAAAAVGTLLVIAMMRSVALPLGHLAGDLKALSEEAKTLDTIATAQRALDANIELMRTLLYGHGDPIRVGDALYFGKYQVNGSNDTVDQIQAAHGGAATIFLGDVRISTNIKDKNGTRVTGTRLAPGPAFDAVLKKGVSYRGEADILGEVYITIYEPIVADRDVIGIIFVAVKKADAVGGAAQAHEDATADEIHRMSFLLQELRAVTVDRQGEMREALNQRYVLGDARRRSEAIGRAAAMAQLNVVGALSTALERLAGADLTHRIDVAFPAEYQTLKENFSSALSALRDTMRAIMGEAKSMRGHSAEIAQAVDELSRRTEQQAASLEETSAALTLITGTVKRTADGVDDARKVVTNAKSDAEHSSEIVRQAVEAMSAIENSSKQISQIIGVIDDIALQTNLLALNAGVEAARAGDAGKGFAVVASEVRALAQRSAEAAKEIKSLISASTQQVNHGVALVGETGRSLERIVAQVAEVDGIVTVISASAQEQALTLQEVSTAVRQMDQATQQNAAMVEESTAASHHLAQEAGKLEQLVGQFQTGAADTVRVVALPPGERSAKANVAKPATSAPRPMMKVAATGSGSAARKPQAAADKEWEEF